jgi:hypothetical protein
MGLMALVAIGMFSDLVPSSNAAHGSLFSPFSLCRPG